MDFGQVEVSWRSLVQMPADRTISPKTLKSAFAGNE